MIQLTSKQLNDAANLACRLEALEAGKDALAPKKVVFDLGGEWRAERFEVEVSAEAARKHANELIVKGHKDLAAFGIELLPAEVSNG